MFQPKPAPIVTRPPESQSSEAIVVASVIGSDSTGSATAVTDKKTGKHLSMEIRMD